MTQEEKAKRYDELLLKLQKAKVDDNVCDEMYYRVIDDIVPELKESEDEKIRKEILDCFVSMKKQGCFPSKHKEQYDAWVAWLEKQKEYESTDFEYVWDRTDCGELTSALDKYSEEAIINMCHAWYDKGIELERKSWFEKQGIQPRYNIGDVICDKLCTTLNKEAQPNMEIVDIQNEMYICDKGSFPVSQQDEYELVSRKIDTKLNDNSVSNELRAASIKHAEKEILNHTFPNDEEFELVYTFEEGAKWNAAQKPTWSNKDKKILDELITFFTKMVLPKDHDFRIYASWLKALKAQNEHKSCTTDE